MQHDQLAQSAHPFTSTNNAPKTKSIPIMYFINFSDSPNLQLEHAMGTPTEAVKRTSREDPVVPVRRNSLAA
jgi:hypothetical protein